jgi:alpha-tubulin suppressor-like RCC1 family protein
MGCLFTLLEPALVVDLTTRKTSIPITFPLTPTQVPNVRGAIAISSGDGFGLALKNDGTVWAWGFNGVGQLGDGSTILQVADRRRSKSAD